MKYYLRQNGKEIGPYSEDELLAMSLSAKVNVREKSDNLLIMEI